jgi:hypothetical protein
MPARQRKRLVLAGMIDGLIRLVEHYEQVPRRQRLHDPDHQLHPQ